MNILTKNNEYIGLMKMGGYDDRSRKCHFEQVSTRYYCVSYIAIVEHS